MPGAVILPIGTYLELGGQDSSCSVEKPMRCRSPALCAVLAAAGSVRHSSIGVI